VAGDLAPAEGFDAKAPHKTALCGFDLDAPSGGTGDAARGCLLPPNDGAAHRFDDLTVAADGTVYLSDAEAPAIYRLKPGAAALEPWVDGREVVSPNGLALSAKGEALYVADYTQGLLRIDTATGKAARLPAEVPTVGIDGLARLGDRTLVAVQNGVAPPRILRIDLDEKGEGVDGAEAVELGREDWDEPTLGCVAGGDYYYVSNSHWPRFGDDGAMKEGPPVTPPAVMRLAGGDLRPASSR
jgi:sugar lactone lactonase YvrE